MENPITIRTAETEVQAHSAVLRKELGLFDLVMAQVLLVIVLDFFGTAAKAGSSHVAFWLVAFVLFFIPLAMVVAYLNRLMPLEGGLYEWARLAFGDQIGFLVAWNLWLFVTLYVAVIGLVTTTFVAYALGPAAAWMASSRWLILTVSFALILAMMLMAALGLRVGKWLSNVGSIATLITLVVLIATPLLNRWHGTLAAYHPLRLVMPPLTVFSLSVFTKMMFGALSGFEYVAIFAGECRNPARNLTRSVLITAPFIALIYIFATSSILAFVSPDAVDVVAPIPQALRLGSRAFGFSGFLVPLAIVLLFVNYPTSFSVYFSASARLPMVAGWDHLLPAWFTRLHAKYKTPVNSILFLGAVTLAGSVAALIGVGPQEAYELLLTWGFTFYAIAYLALFAIPFLSAKERGLRPGLWLRAAAVSGFLMTLLYVVLSIFPIVDVESSWGYSLKIAAVVLGANILGWLIYRAGRQRQRQ
ncbi:MAG: APC family permease [Candidatus Sulfotelmatobacter sp.]|jgi:amino acid transporter